MENFKRRHRQSYRLRGHDYSGPSSYFVTLCVEDKECLFGHIADGGVQLNPFGQIVHEEWLRSADIRNKIVLDAFVVMPNHLHGIVTIIPAGAHSGTPLPTATLHRPPHSLGSFVAGFKSSVTARINRIRNMPGLPVWQRNYQEWIIRDNGMLNRVRRYIKENPSRWGWDR